MGVAGAITASAYFKTGTATYGWITNSALNVRAIFNATTGAFTGWEGTPTGHTFSSQVLPNGWIRAVLSWTAAGAGHVQLGLSMSPTSGVGLNNGKTMYLWGAQVEQASVASSYIPTVAAAVSRNADVLLYPAASNINGAVGTDFAEAVVRLADGIVTKGIISLEPSTCYPLALFSQVGTFDGTTLITTVNVVTPDVLFKCASRWGAAGAQMGVCLNGGTIVNGAFDGAMGGTSLGIGNWTGGSLGTLRGTVRNVKIYNTALSDAELQAMTT
jgi:hypothetical protein